ncbi:MAG: hypothetical protein Fur0018_12140 [Anaerolineales bacterium]
MRHFFPAPPNPPAPGLYHFMRQSGAEKTRLHLRIDPDGHGTLLINANQMVHFNPTAAFMAYLRLTETPAKQARRALQRAYRVSSAQAKRDYAQFSTDLENLVRPDACLFCAVEGLEISAPFSERPSAPYRMDLALTYRCNNDCAHCYNVSDRHDPELDTADWKAILDRLWEIGAPHIVFTGGEPTLRADLPELIAHAEHNGQITGLNTNGRRLRDPRFVEALVQAGLDHVQITLESHEAAIHDHMVRCKGAWKQTVEGLRNALASPLFVMTNTTMLRDNVQGLPATLDFLAELGVPTIGLNALIYSGRGKDVGTGLPAQTLPALLEMARTKTQSAGQKLIWYTPTQYCHFDPVQLELGVKGCTAALYNMCIEPDGAVLPCQSYYRPVGNIRRDPWERIWEHDLCRALRERRYTPAACQDCALLSECGAGCPLALEDQPAPHPVVGLVG